MRLPRENLIASPPMKAASKWALGLGLTLALIPAAAQALPGFFAGKGSTPITSSSTQVVVYMRDDTSVVTVITDFDGPDEKTALVMPVPKDVEVDAVKTLQRGSVERLDELTAPRFHEFWEMDPCEPGKAEQIWERSLVASSDTDFLGAGDMFKDTKKAPPEMKIKVEPSYRDQGSEFEFFVVKDDIGGWLKGKGYKMPEGLSVDAYSDSAWLVAIVDPDKVELGKTGEKLLSGVRYVTKSPVKLASTLGLANLKNKQELVIYTVHPEKRFEAANYDNVVPPTNLQVDFAVKERIGEYYAALHDMLLQKNKQGILVEYAWDTKTCGEPCPNAELALHELLTLGGDVHELDVPEEQKNPEPPERTEEEQKIYDEKEKDKQKEEDEVRVEVARRKKLIERHDNYVITRLHHRYDKEGLPKDIELKSAPHLQGGVEIPQGADGVLPQGAKTGGDSSTLQTRFVHLHPNKAVVECASPENYRWGKPPRTYRGLRKIWVANQLATRNRTNHKPTELTLTAVPDLGIKGVPSTAEREAAEKAAAAEAAAKEGDCDCSVVGEQTRLGGGLQLALAALLGGVLLRGRRRR